MSEEELAEAEFAAAGGWVPEEVQAWLGSKPWACPSRPCRPRPHDPVLRAPAARAWPCSKRQRRGGGPRGGRHRRRGGARGGRKVPRAAAARLSPAGAAATGWIR
jgi:hypothetical protein